MNTQTRVPPGFRFHPTDEELVDYYLRRKVSSRRIDLDVIKDVDLYKIEPWDLQELCQIGTEEQNDQWYFFSHKDKKYPTGTRTNRATSAGFWKATGRDKAIYSKREIVGMRKTLVFYKGRAPNGQKSDWIMHEYRLESDENGTTQEEGWAVCKVFKKRIATLRKLNERGSPSWYEDQASFMSEMESPSYMNPHRFLQLPNLESPKFVVPQTDIAMPSLGGLNMDPRMSYQRIIGENRFQCMSEQCGDDQVTDWRVLDRFVASQLSQDEMSNGNKKELIMSVVENGSTSSSSCQIDMWK